jgi:hypothetical protein
MAGGVGKEAIGTLRLKQAKSDSNQLGLCNHEKALLLEFYRLKNSGREAGSINTAESWLLQSIKNSKEHHRCWEIYLQANETPELKERRLLREEQKVAAAKKTLAKARRKIKWKTWLIKTMSVKVKRTTSRRRKVESPLRPNLDGIIERKPNRRRPSLAAPQGTRHRAIRELESKCFVREEFVSTYHVPTSINDRLRTDKRLGKYMVPRKRASPLRESVTRA